MAKFTRLSWNSKNWEVPSGPENKCYGTSDRLFECVYGFGWEEWLFHYIKHKDGYCYGFLECFNYNGRQSDSIEELYLYTRRCKGSCDKKSDSTTYYVGKINNVDVLGREHRDLIYQVILENEIEMKNDMQNAGVMDYEILCNEMKECRSVFNIRFKKEDVHICKRKIDDRAIRLPKGLYRFQLYDIAKRKDLLKQLTNLY